MNFRYNFISLILILLSLIHIKSYIVLPFEEIEKSAIYKIYEFDTVNQLLYDMNYLKLYTIFYLGSSPHKLPVSLNANINYFALKDNNEELLRLDSPNNYYPSSSESLKFEDFFEENAKVIVDGTDVLSYASETIHFLMTEGDITSIYSNKEKGIIDANKYHSFNNINFYIPESKEISRFCGVFGFSNTNLLIISNFFDELYKKRLIESKVWSVDFPDFEEDTMKKGNIIIGELPHIYNPQYYQENQYFTTKIIDNNKGWEIKIDSATILKQYYENTNKKEIGASMSYIETITIDFGKYMMYAPKKLFDQLKELYFEKLFDYGICDYKKVKLKSDVIIVIFCDQKLFGNNEKNNFPKIIFDVQNLGGSLELNYKDVFITKNDKIIFMIAFSSEKIKNTIQLGQIFLYKYQFTFDYQNNEIGFYKTDLNSKRVLHRIKRTFRGYIFLIIVILIIIIGSLYYCYKKRWLKGNKTNKNKSNFTGDNIQQMYELKNDN